MIQLVDRQLKIIFCLLTSPKFDFGVVVISMFQVVARQLELIFFHLTSPKCDLGEIDKAMFQRIEVILNSFLAS